jgi:hypothetical protein
MDGLRKRPGSRRWCALRPGMRRRRAPGLGSRMADGGSAMTSRATEELERVRGQKIDKCGERERGA